MTGKADVDQVSRMDGFKWAAVAALVGVGVFGNAHYSGESLLYRVVALLVLAIIAGLIALQTAKGQSFWQLIKDSKTEIRKVVWPSRQETLQTTLIVVVVVLIMGLILWGLDSLLGWTVSSLIG